MFKYMQFISCSLIWESELICYQERRYFLSCSKYHRQVSTYTSVYFLALISTSHVIQQIIVYRKDMLIRGKPGLIRSVAWIWHKLGLNKASLFYCIFDLHVYTWAVLSFCLHLFPYPNLDVCIFLPSSSACSASFIICPGHISQPLWFGLTALNVGSINPFRNISQLLQLGLSGAPPLWQLNDKYEMVRLTTSAWATELFRGFFPFWSYVHKHADLISYNCIICANNCNLLGQNYSWRTQT